VLRNSGVDSMRLNSVKGMSGKAVARHCATLFVVLWVLMFAYVTVLAGFFSVVMRDCAQIGRNAARSLR
jgi:hypothetical protein